MKLINRAVRPHDLASKIKIYEPELDRRFAIKNCYATLKHFTGQYFLESTPGECRPEFKLKPRGTPKKKAVFKISILLEYQKRTVADKI